MGPIFLEVVRILNGFAAIGRTAGVAAQGIDLLVDHLHRLVIRIHSLWKTHMIASAFLHGITSAHRMPLQRSRMHGIIFKNYQEVRHV